MTSEVAVLNRNAIALAADSAVTIGGQKIYNSALKLFSLSKVAPIAVMVYGDALFHDTPWETIFKLYRRQLKGRTFPTVEAYSKDFLRFVERNHSFVPSTVQERWVTGRAQLYIRELVAANIEDESRKVIDRAGSISVAETKKLATTVITAAYRSMRGKKRLQGFTAKQESLIFRQYRKVFTALIEEHLGKFKLSAASIRQLRWSLVWFHTRLVLSSEGSGIVIAGFGEKQIFPSVYTHQVAGMIGNKLACQFVSQKSRTISSTVTGSVIAFAQEDMVQTFMSGINMQLQTFIWDYISRIATKIGDLVPDAALAGSPKVRGKFRADFANQAKAIADGFLTEIQKHKKSYQIDPVMDMVNVLPKDELAAMAETLVNITAFKRRMSRTFESVGGPIDVVVISKGDGLVWVKRKLYFPGNLNHGFFKNYMRGMHDGT